MATTEDRLQPVDQLEQLYRNSPDVEPPRRLSLNDWCPRLLTAWLAVFGSIVLFEPAPSDPQAAVPAWGTMLLAAFTVALLAAIVGLSLRRPWSLRASVGAGALGIAIGAACVVTDHHMGFWGAYEIVAFSGLTAASYIGTRATA
jgi:peptidoglycan/LPS O-acetylase OafA/YrhL